ncbi:hypothetical protein ES332_D12G015100v1 [Gossypium tomentosum]|uniref:Uncharacterized protein n=1 Tax=Gossypium tomentosum TaxID=34277 RepID=A0A5D2I3E3_GOSTO|nr:hypothetical protein ES332_D12G015100v1 [Gossypium tomentosum]
MYTNAYWHMKDFSRFSVFHGGVFATTVICFQASYQSFHYESSSL